MNTPGIPRRARSLFATLSMLYYPLTAPPAALALDLDGSTLTVQNQYLYTNNGISGANPSGSFLTPGAHGTDDLGLLYNAKSGDTTWEGALDGRYSDDKRIEAEKFNLKRFYLKGDNARGSVAAGDYFASFSQYSLGTALKGSRYTLKLADKLDLTALAGIAKPSWGDLWAHSKSETVDRMFYGLRASKTFADDGFIGGSLVWDKDSRSVFNSSAAAQNQRISAIDWSLPVFQRLHLYGESAYAKTVSATPGLPDSGQQGWANLVKADYSYKRFRTQNVFERVDSGFATNGGAAAPDLVRAQTQNKLSLAGPWQGVINYTWFHNNLADTAGVPTYTTRLPEAGLRYDGPDWRPGLSAEVKARQRSVTSSLTGQPSVTRSLLASYTDRFGPVNLNVDYEFQNEVSSGGALSGNHNIFGIGFTSMHQFRAGWRLMPSLRYNLQNDRDNLIGNTGQAGLVMANLACESPWGLDAGTSYSRNLVLSGVNPGSDRRSESVSIGYNINKKPEHRLTLRFNRNDNRFTAPGQNFKETILEAGLTDRF